jgi:hypothetical protein
MSDLDDFIAEADKNSAFIKFEEGEPVVGILKKTELIADPFNIGQKTMQYTLEVDGVQKTFKSKSAKLARLVKKFGVGDEIEVVKTGEGFKTLWYVDTPDKPKK